MDHNHIGLVLNGLLPNEAASLPRTLEPKARWMKAEQRTEELIDLIQPNPSSLEFRSAVVDFVQRLITKYFYCQVVAIGSVPLKTYLPDADIDLTVFSEDEILKDSWVNEFRIILENEEKSENAKFNVKRVQCMQAEVMIIKCVVEDIVVNISFNQLGGPCALRFFEGVDNLIKQNHIFKRSIILIKAWCHHEACVLGAHHGLISTYALETLVSYIFHVFDNSFVGPLEVLYRFLEIFSNFDWDKYCVTLWGPIPISSLPDMTAESPRKDCKKGVLFWEVFLNSCSTVAAVIQRGKENHSQAFISKHFNVVDSLCLNNNLGRGVSKGNLFRIRSAFMFGAKMLARVLYCPEEDLIAEVNHFFSNTLDRYGGDLPDTSTFVPWRLRQLNLDPHNGPENLKNYSNNKDKNDESEAAEGTLWKCNQLKDQSDKAL